MVLSEQKKREYIRRIMMVRMKLLCEQGFYGLLLMHMHFHLSEENATAWTDGKENIYFNPRFLDCLMDCELEYVMVHLLLHTILEHFRRREGYDRDRYNEAADIVVNSNIMRSYGEDEYSICLNPCGGVQPHQLPDGEEGWQYTVEEVYTALGSGGVGQKASGAAQSSVSGGQAGVDGSDNGGTGAGNDRGNGKGQGGGSEGNSKGDSNGPGRWDNHPDAQDSDTAESQRQRAMWEGRMLQAAESMKAREQADLQSGKKACGSVPACVERYLKELKHPQVDWRTILDEFVQEEINDYSFCPPDRRFSESDFFLPDFNEKEDKIEKILFMIDTSGSMSDEEITDCYSEVKGAIDQFNGRLEGWLGFFDAKVVTPEPFGDEEEFKVIHPKGGGGTSFEAIFQYIRKHMEDDLPVSIIILTDGYAPYPKREAAMGIPVLWIVNNEEMTPPWGRIARILPDRNGKV